MVDVYRLTWKKFFIPRYYIRPITRLLPAKLLHRLVRFHVAWVYPLTGSLHRIGLASSARGLSNILGMVDHRGLFQMTRESGRELSELDTFDALSPAYDRPQTLKTVQRWFMQAGLVNVEVKPGFNGIVGLGRKPV